MPDHPDARAWQATEFGKRHNSFIYFSHNPTWIAAAKCCDALE
jgi:hypothetical protein